MRLAAHWDGYKWNAFISLDGDEQSEIIATYRAYNQMEAVIANELARKSRRTPRR
jgi:hypothetical protein